MINWEEQIFNNKQKHEYLKQKRLAPTIEIRLDVKLSSRVSKTSAKHH